jgi:hypothetical protein
VIRGVGAGFVPLLLDRAIIDEVVPIGDDEAFAHARRLAREEGILAGISSGATLAAALHLAARPAYAGKTIVFMICDSCERYTSGPLVGELVGDDRMIRSVRSVGPDVAEGPDHDEVNARRIGGDANPVLIRSSGACRLVGPRQAGVRRSDDVPVLFGPESATTARAPAGARIAVGGDDQTLPGRVRGYRDPNVRAG